MSFFNAPRELQLGASCLCLPLWARLRSWPARSHGRKVIPSLVIVNQQVGRPSVIGHFELIYLGENQYLVATFRKLSLRRFSYPFCLPVLKI